MFDLEIVIIRDVRKSDLPALEWDGEYKHFRKIYRRALREAEQGHRILLVAELEKAIVGQIFIYLAHNGCDFVGKSSAHLYSFRVRETYRNLGIGTKLLDEAETILTRRGFTRATISVAKNNEHARRMYERNGYSICREDEGEWSFLDHQGVLRTIREPSYILEKKLKMTSPLR